LTDDKMLRISRYLTRARELETDPAKMKQDRVARLASLVIRSRQSTTAFC